VDRVTIVGPLVNKIQTEESIRNKSFKKTKTTLCPLTIPTLLSCEIDFPCSEIGKRDTQANQ
jgi:hypothetical protein